ncbi:MAG: imidazoleglycerol-phosphate dehydratase HisB [Ruminococcaceae bacterium]|nr:imidazoleglycerol-phosphate dehydratase HisB [Oscillospiraceae bacterium]
MVTVNKVRNTRETKIDMTLSIRAKEKGLQGSTGIGFFDHMLNSFCIHGGFAIKLDMQGDLQVDGHHTVEDVGIVLGTLFKEALGDKGGIKRFGHSYVPMDESLAFCAVDISGRPYLVYDVPVTAPMIGDYDAQLTVEFMRALAYNMGATLHVKLEYGVNEHHITEAVYKAVARALSQAMEETDGEILSAKGVL